jgi:hypothetical protein
MWIYSSRGPLLSTAILYHSLFKIMMDNSSIAKKGVEVGTLKQSYSSFMTLVCKGTEGEVYFSSLETFHVIMRVQRIQSMKKWKWNSQKTMYVI